MTRILDLCTLKDMVKLKLKGWNDEDSRIRVSDSVLDGSWNLVSDGKMVAWLRKNDRGRWLYSHKGRVMIFKSLTKLIDYADRDLLCLSAVK